MTKKDIIKKLEWMISSPHRLTVYYDEIRELIGAIKKEEIGKEIENGK